MTPINEGTLMRMLAKPIAITITAGAAMALAAPAAGAQPSVSSTLESDIALLQLSSALGLNSAVATASLAAQSSASSVTINDDVGLIHVSETISINSDVPPVTLPVEQHLATAHNTETGYRVDLLPTKENPRKAVQPLQSPGVISGNTVQIPIHLPVNLCGNSIDIIGLVNPTFGNTCVNG